MKKFVFGSLLLACGTTGFSQSTLPANESDSLWRIWLDETKNDSTRVQALRDFNWNGGYLFSQPDSAFFFAQLQYNFAEKTTLLKFKADALNLQGISLSVRGQNEEALTYFLASLKIQQEIGNRHGIAMLLNSIGTVYNEVSNYIAAKDYYLQSFKIQEEIGNKKGMAVALNNLGNTSFYEGNFAQAFEYYQQALTIYKETGNQKGASEALNNIGIIYHEFWQTDQALEYYYKSLEMKLESGDKRGASRSMNNLGDLYLYLEDFAKAEALFEETLQLKLEVKDVRGQAMAFNNLATVYFKIEDNDKALQYYQKALAIRTEIGDKHGEAQTLNNIAGCYFSKGDYQAAIENGLKSYTIASEIGSPILQRGSSVSLYGTYLALDDIDRCMFYLAQLRQSLVASVRSNFFSLTEAEKETYFAQMEPDFGHYYDFTVFYHDSFPNLPDTAYNIALLNKGLTLKSSSAMRSVILNSGDTTLISEYEKWIALKHKISDSFANGKDTRDLEKQASTIEKNLVKKSNVFNDFNNVQNLDWKQVRDALQPNECAIEFLHFTSQVDPEKPVIYAALLVKQDSEHPVVIRLCKETDLVDILGTFQGNNLTFINSVYGTRDKARDALYQKLWHPLEKHLSGIKTIYYSPSGLLHKISFAAICKEKSIFLSGIFDFRQMSSTGRVALSGETTLSGPESFLLMGGVDFNSSTTLKETWPYLPGSLKETDDIDAYLQKKKYRIGYFHGENATESVFKENCPGADIIHIATHGFFFPDPQKIRESMRSASESGQELIFRGATQALPGQSTNYANWSFVNNKNPLMRSGIVLAGANDVWERAALAEGEDGILTAQEVSNLDMSGTKLVVLSACETGLGDIKGSEGVFGLQRAFKMAGVQYMIMSLWQVPDKETSEFMQLFYKNLVRLKDIPAAFQKTQKVMRDKYDPYYWGAFVLIE